MRANTYPNDLLRRIDDIKDATNYLVKKTVRSARNVLNRLNKRKTQDKFKNSTNK